MLLAHVDAGFARWSPLKSARTQRQSTLEQILLGPSATPLWEASGRHFDAAGACGRWFCSLEALNICENTTAEHFGIHTFGRPQRPPLGGLMGAILTLLAHVDAGCACWPPLKYARTQRLQCRLLGDLSDPPLGGLWAPF